jgi:hypothetical protein
MQQTTIDQFMAAELRDARSIQLSGCDQSALVLGKVPPWLSFHKTTLY